MKIKCKICRHRFTLTKEMLYLAQEVATGIYIVPQVTKMFDAVDCPKCGCQLLLNVREPEIHAKGGEPVEIVERDFEAATDAHYQC